jgi:tripeptide aminopeptidase
MMFALALADVKAGGWFGKVVKGKRQGTRNVGPVTGGEGRPAGDATNVVTDYVHVRGESRSHDSKFFKEITQAYKTALEKVAKRVASSDGKSGRVKFKAETEYHPFRMKERLPAVMARSLCRLQHAVDEAFGLRSTRVANAPGRTRTSCSPELMLRASRAENRRSAEDTIELIARASR